MIGIVNSRLAEKDCVEKAPPLPTVAPTHVPTVHSFCSTASRRSPWHSHSAPAVRALVSPFSRLVAIGRIFLSSSSNLSLILILSFSIFLSGLAARRVSPHGRSGPLPPAPCPLPPPRRRPPPPRPRPLLTTSVAESLCPLLSPLRSGAVTAARRAGRGDQEGGPRGRQVHHPQRAPQRPLPPWTHSFREPLRFQIRFVPENTF